MTRPAFLLDEDIAKNVATMLKRAGYRVHSAQEAGLGTADDDQLTIWADDKGFILITHDQQFSLRRRESPIGRHIWLQCRETDAAEVLGLHLPEILDLCRREHVMIKVTRTAVTPWPR